jgi:hypothetical protein
VFFSRDSNFHHLLAPLRVPFCHSCSAHRSNSCSMRTANLPPTHLTTYQRCSSATWRIWPELKLGNGAGLVRQGLRSLRGWQLEKRLRGWSPRTRAGGGMKHTGKCVHAEPLAVRVCLGGGHTCVVTMLCQPYAQVRFFWQPDSASWCPWPT